MEKFSDYERKFLEEIQKLPEEEKNKREKRKEDFDRAVRTEKGKLQLKEIFNCPICTEDFVLEDVRFCTKSHHICKNCLRESINETVANASPSQLCKTEINCSGVYPDNILRNLLKPEELKAFDTGIFNSNVERAFPKRFPRCPACNWGYLLEVGQKIYVFNCRKRTCMKSFCMLCGQASHRNGERCPREEENEENYGRVVAEALSEAAIRRCPRCHQGVLKISNCNHITHTCGCHFCYWCLQEFPASTIYNHVGPIHPGSDDPNNDPQVRRKIGEAGLAAAAKWRAEHPNFNHVKLNVQKIIDDFLKN